MYSISVEPFLSKGHLSRKISGVASQFAMQNSGIATPVMPVVDEVHSCFATEKCEM
jgi:hypothetical protein